MGPSTASSIPWTRAEKDGVTVMKSGSPATYCNKPYCIRALWREAKLVRFLLWLLPPHKNKYTHREQRLEVRPWSDVWMVRTEWRWVCWGGRRLPSQTDRGREVTPQVMRAHERAVEHANTRKTSDWNMLEWSICRRWHLSCGFLSALVALKSEAHTWVHTHQCNQRWPCAQSEC